MQSDPQMTWCSTWYSSVKWEPDKIQESGFDN